MASLALRARIPFKQIPSFDVTCFEFQDSWVDQLAKAFAVQDGSTRTHIHYRVELFKDWELDKFDDFPFAIQQPVIHVWSPLPSSLEIDCICIIDGTTTIPTDSDPAEMQIQVKILKKKQGYIVQLSELDVAKTNGAGCAASDCCSFSPILEVVWGRRLASQYFDLLPQRLVDSASFRIRGVVIHFCGIECNGLVSWEPKYLTGISGFNRGLKQQFATNAIHQCLSVVESTINVWPGSISPCCNECMLPTCYWSVTDDFVLKMVNFSFLCEDAVFLNQPPIQDTGSVAVSINKAVGRHDRNSLVPHMLHQLTLSGEIFGEWVVTDVPVPLVFTYRQECGIKCQDKISKRNLWMGKLASEYKFTDFVLNSTKSGRVDLGTLLSCQSVIGSDDDDTKQNIHTLLAEFNPPEWRETNRMLVIEISASVFVDQWYIFPGKVLVENAIINVGWIQPFSKRRMLFARCKSVIKLPNIDSIKVEVSMLPKCFDTGWRSNCIRINLDPSVSYNIQLPALLNWVNATELNDLWDNIKKHELPPQFVHCFTNFSVEEFEITWSPITTNSAADIEETKDLCCKSRVNFGSMRNLFLTTHKFQCLYIKITIHNPVACGILKAGAHRILQMNATLNMTPDSHTYVLQAKTEAVVCIDSEMGTRPVTVQAPIGVSPLPNTDKTSIEAFQAAFKMAIQKCQGQL